MPTNQSFTKNTEAPVIDMLDAMRPVFASGKGTICVPSGVTYAELLSSIKLGMSFGKPFLVIPPTA